MSVPARYRFGPILRVSQAELKHLASVARASSDGNETGGLLFGEAPSNQSSTEFEVRHAGDAGPAAIRQPTFFRPDVVHAQRLALDWFAADGSQWIGTWHTHIRWRASRPSHADLTTYRSHLRDPALAFSSFVCVIATPTLSRSLQLNWQRVNFCAWLISPRTVTAMRIVKAH